MRFVLTGKRWLDLGLWCDFEARAWLVHLEALLDGRRVIRGELVAEGAVALYVIPSPAEAIRRGSRYVELFESRPGHGFDEALTRRFVVGGTVPRSVLEAFEPVD